MFFICYATVHDQQNTHACSTVCISHIETPESFFCCLSYRSDDHNIREWFRLFSYENGHEKRQSWKLTYFPFYLCLYFFRDVYIYEVTLKIFWCKKKYLGTSAWKCSTNSWWRAGTVAAWAAQSQGISWSPRCYASIKLSAQVLGKAVHDGPNTWIPAPRVGDLMEFQAVGLGWPCLGHCGHLGWSSRQKVCFSPPPSCHVIPSTTFN